jgi:hypothetical protein
MSNTDTGIHIAVLIMAKNEKKCLHYTLESIKGFADSLIMYDTGSTDNTIELTETFCKNNNIPFRLKQGEFIDFATSRNASLDFADTFSDISYILLLDVNDELRYGDKLRKMAEQLWEKPNSAFLVCQEWWSGQYDKYYNIRFVKAREGWRYNGRIHEWIYNKKHKDVDKEGNYVSKISAEYCVIYQDRTHDDDKSGKRYTRDKELLLQDHKEKPNESRTLFYLAQTCSCLNQLDDALYYYKMRSTMDGFQEENFHSLLRLGDLSKTLLHPWHDTLIWYMKAFEHSPRAEPLIKISSYYREEKNWLLAFTFIELACKLDYPEHLNLFVDKHAYVYTRWHLLGIIGYYAGFFKEGKNGCIKAIETCLSKEIDERNLKFYEDREKDLLDKQTQQVPKTKKEFINNYTTELSKSNPSLTKKQLTSLANAKWKETRTRT